MSGEKTEQALVLWRDPLADFKHDSRPLRNQEGTQSRSAEEMKAIWASLRSLFERHDAATPAPSRGRSGIDTSLPSSFIPRRPPSMTVVPLQLAIDASPESPLPTIAHESTSLLSPSQSVESHTGLQEILLLSSSSTSDLLDSAGLPVCSAAAHATPAVAPNLPSTTHLGDSAGRKEKVEEGGGQPYLLEDAEEKEATETPMKQAGSTMDGVNAAITLLAPSTSTTYGTEPDQPQIMAEPTGPVTLAVNIDYESHLSQTDGIRAVSNEHDNRSAHSCDSKITSSPDIAVMTECPASGSCQVSDPQSGVPIHIQAGSPEAIGEGSAQADDTEVAAGDRPSMREGNANLPAGEGSDLMASDSTGQAKDEGAGVTNSADGIDSSLSLSPMFEVDNDIPTKSACPAQQHNESSSAIQADDAEAKESNESTEDDARSTTTAPLLNDQTPPASFRPVAPHAIALPNEELEADHPRIGDDSQATSTTKARAGIDTGTAFTSTAITDPDPTAPTVDNTELPGLDPNAAMTKAESIPTVDDRLEVGTTTAELSTEPSMPGQDNDRRPPPERFKPYSIRPLDEHVGLDIVSSQNELVPLSSTPLDSDIRTSAGDVHHSGTALGGNGDLSATPPCRASDGNGDSAATSDDRTEGAGCDPHAAVAPSGKAGARDRTATASCAIITGGNTAVPPTTSSHHVTSLKRKVSPDPFSGAAEDEEDSPLSKRHRGDITKTPSLTVDVVENADRFSTDTHNHPDTDVPGAIDADVLSNGELEVQVASEVEEPPSPPSKASYPSQPSPFEHGQGEDEARGQWRVGRLPGHQGSHIRRSDGAPSSAGQKRSASQMGGQDTDKVLKKPFRLPAKVSLAPAKTTPRRIPWPTALQESSPNDACNPAQAGDTPVSVAPRISKPTKTFVVPRPASPDRGPSPTFSTIQPPKPRTVKRTFVSLALSSSKPSQPVQDHQRDIKSSSPTPETPPNSSTPSSMQPSFVASTPSSLPASSPIASARASKPFRLPFTRSAAPSPMTRLKLSASTSASRNRSMTLRERIMEVEKQERTLKQALRYLSNPEEDERLEELVVKWKAAGREIAELLFDVTPKPDVDAQAGQRTSGWSSYDDRGGEGGMTDEQLEYLANAPIDSEGKPLDENGNPVFAQVEELNSRGMSVGRKMGSIDPLMSSYGSDEYGMGMVNQQHNDVWDIGTMLEKIGVDDPTLFDWDADKEDWRQPDDDDDDLPC